jgi:protein-tyrosine phosphatase
MGGEDMNYKKLLQLTIFTLILINQAMLQAEVQNKIKYDTRHKWATPLDESIVRNGYKINDKIYRSAQPTQKAFKKLYNIGIRKTLNLRLFHSDYKEINGLPIEEIHIPLFILDIETDELIEIVNILHNTKEPTLVHCKYGADRTGVVIAAYRILVENWSSEEAIKEMKEGGYGHLNIWRNLPKILKLLEKTKFQQK